MVMEFRLVYRGELPPNGKPQDKALIRRAFHTQLRELWSQQPLRGLVEDFRLYADPKYEGDKRATFVRNGPFLFLPLVSSSIFLVVQLNILFLRRQPPGFLVGHAGDLDNRIKTPFDALRVPRELQDLPPGSSPGADETPYHCLLEDDALITGFSVETDRLLDAKRDEEVLLVIQVRMMATRKSWQNMEIT